MEQKFLGLIINAAIESSSGKKGKSGSSNLIITFSTEDNVIKDDIVEMLYGEEKHYFEVHSIAIEGKNLIVKAGEVGYWARKLERQKTFDLRSIIGNTITHIQDTEKLKEIHTMSCWC